MRKLMLVLAMSVAFLFGCEEMVEYDYDTESFEQALMNGEDVTGAIVFIKVKEVEEGGAFGYNMKAGENLNFVSSVKPTVEAGGTALIEVERYGNVFGSFIITYGR